MPAQTEIHIRDYNRVGRNDACPCGSGNKFKNCCGSETGKKEQQLSIEKVYQMALGHLNAGNFERAFELAEKITTHNPGNVPTMQLSAAILLQQGDKQAARKKLETALRFAPNNEVILAQLGTVCIDLDQFEEGEKYFAKAIKHNATYAPAYFNWAISLNRQSRHADAEKRFRQAIKHNPQYHIAYVELARLFNATGRFQEALDTYGEIVNNGVAEMQLFIEVGHVLGNLREFERAESAYRQAAELDEASPVPWDALSKMFMHLGKHDESFECSDKAMSLAPKSQYLLFQRGLLLRAANKKDDAVVYMKKALEIAPEFVEAWINLGALYGELEQYDDAIMCTEKVMEIQPQQLLPYQNRGLIYQFTGELDKALADFDYILERSPDYAEAHFRKGWIYLLQENYLAGWQEYEWRFKRRERINYAVDPRTGKTTLPLPSSYTGHDLQGKKLLLLSDQGLGDDIFFLRFASVAKALGCSLSYRTVDKIDSLVRRIDSIDEVLASSDSVPDHYDHILSLPDLPLLVGNNTAVAPVRIEPLTDKLEYIRSRLAECGPGPYLAITWRAGTSASNSKSLSKSIRENELASTIKDWPGSVIVVQRDPLPDEMEIIAEILESQVFDFSDLNDDLEGMLALMDKVDEYAGVSNTNMHLRAALNKSARILVPLPPEWRWLAQGESSSWFPDFKLYRYNIQDKWNIALAALEHDIKQASKQGAA